MGYYFTMAKSDASPFVQPFLFEIKLFQFNPIQFDVYHEELKSANLKTELGRTTTVAGSAGTIKGVQLLE